MDTTSSESENNACLPTWIAAVFNDSPLQTSFTNCTVEKTPIVILKRAVGHTPKSKTLDEVYLHPKANQMIEAFDKANQLVKDEVLALPEE